MDKWSGTDEVQMDACQGYANVTGRLVGAATNGGSVVAIAGADPTADAVNVVLEETFPKAITSS